MCQAPQQAAAHHACLLAKRLAEANQRAEAIPPCPPTHRPQIDAALFFKPHGAWGRCVSSTTNPHNPHTPRTMPSVHAPIDSLPNMRKRPSVAAGHFWRPRKKRLKEPQLQNHVEKLFSSGRNLCVRGGSRTSHHRFGGSAADRRAGRTSLGHGPRLGAVDAHFGRCSDHSELLHVTHQTAERLSRDPRRSR